MHSRHNWRSIVLCRCSRCIVVTIDGASYDVDEFWLENKITENQWKITETIYIHFKIVHFWPVLTVLSSNFSTVEKSWNQLNNCKKITRLINFPKLQILQSSLQWIIHKNKYYVEQIHSSQHKSIQLHW